ncbi:aminoglycoside phosphotransferase family protein [Paenarthrobacter sp. Z7-10]|uniref:aminoglycoside phosphotransferase family protein n=1 Tax=Paenarthrobacter sp. Z7-10 TaxID=2787635 RepID=UPI0022A8F080|nr:aminoglycoside phosphotransferase family protein [Paenarthrobacter sp. Z7-10]MCZ2404225.1 aminoglycoside phosphotransferase family protein [Paenarthrobacter sp. Z7-10]
MPDQGNAPIDSDLARRLVGSQFPHWAQLPISTVDPGGWDNRTFRLGAKLSIRLPSGPGYAQQVRKEQHWLPLLATGLPLPIPTPVAEGLPAEGYPYPWSIYQWLDGQVASETNVADPTRFATALAGFLNVLHQREPTGGPAPGSHNCFRGASPTVYADETLSALEALGTEVPAEPLRRLWDHAVGAHWDGDPVWFHGDVATANLLVSEGQLSAVIDFGCSGVGDPACDLVIAWTFLHGSARDAFRKSLNEDAATWSRGRGWALWKALISLVAALENNPKAAAGPRRDIQRLLLDFSGET